MALFEAIRIVRNQWRMLLLLCLSATVTTGLLTYVVSEKYDASALILVRPQPNITINPVKDDRQLLNFPLVGGSMSKVEIPSNTYIEIIRSRAVGEKVVRLLHLDREKVVSGPYLKRVMASMRKKGRELAILLAQIGKYGRVIGQPSALEKAVEDFERNVSLKAIKDAYQFEIKYASEDPQEAADVANTAVNVFLEHMRELNAEESSSTVAYLAEQLRRSEKELFEARAALRQFKEANGTVSFKDEATEEIKIIAGMESDLEKANVKLAGLVNQLAPSNPKVESLEAEKVRLVAAIKQRQTKLHALPERERQLTTLTVRVDTLDDTVKLINKEYEQARIRSGTSVREIEVVSRAVPPFYPARPVKAMYVMAALVISLLAGIGFALVREYLKRSVETVEQAERVLQLRVLATLPRT